VPELLEIEVYRGLAERAVGCTIATVHADDAWYLKGGLTAEELQASITGETIVAARRHGKLLLLETSGPVLGLRFGMTGRLLVDGTAGIERLEYSSDRDLAVWDRFGLDFTDGGVLAIRDPRRLGGVELDPDLGRLGPDAAALGVDDLEAVLGRSTVALKARLLDQARVAGLGNLLVDDVLWRAGLDPARAAGRLDGEEVAVLADAIATTLDELGRRGGSHTGELQPERHRDGHCPRDGTALQRRTIGGRTTYSCPEHQR
jgi:formamidopyrimidine-DNA glycosylase